MKCLRATQFVSNLHYPAVLATAFYLLAACAQAQQAPLPSSTAGDENDGSRWSRSFADGVTVELIGVGEFPAQLTGKWWNPVGKAVGPPYRFIPRSFLKPNDGRVRLEFAFRVQWKGQTPDDIVIACGNRRGQLRSAQKREGQAEDTLAEALLFHVATRHAALSLRRGEGDDAEAVTFEDVALYPGPQVRGTGQQQARSQRYYIQSVHKSMRGGPAWLDLKRRLETSGMKYTYVSVNERGDSWLNLGTTGTPDLSPLRGAKLDGLSLEHTGRVDLEPLRGMPLKRLSISGSQITDLSPLKGMPLESLDLWGAKVSDLSPLSEARLTSLNAAYSQVKDLGPLAGQPLAYLDLRGTLVADLAPLQGTKLGTLQLEGTQVTDLRPLRDLPLKTLTLRWKDGLDLRQLEGCPLTWLKLTGKGFGDLSVLSGLKLERLYLNGTSVRDLSPLKGMPLRELSLRGTPVVNLVPVQELKLTHLYASEPGVDLAPLRHMPLQHIGIPDPKTVANLDVLRSIKTLAAIRPPSSKSIPVDEFWRWYDQTAQRPRQSGGNS